MVTLTYAGTNEMWAPRHISDYLKRCRAFMSASGLRFRYVWVAELQKRGVIHYHVATWLPVGVELPKPDSVGWWPHGMTRIETARKAVPYLMSYLKKGDNITRGGLPGGARAHGRGGLGEQFRHVLRWLALPAFIQARAAVDERWDRVIGGGWAAPDGSFWPSEFKRVWAGSGYALQRVFDHGRPFAVDGPYSRWKGVTT